MGFPAVVEAGDVTVTLTSASTATTFVAAADELFVLFVAGSFTDATEAVFVIEPPLPGAVTLKVNDAELPAPSSVVVQVTVVVPAHVQPAAGVMEFSTTPAAERLSVSVTSVAASIELRFDTTIV